ncbi:MAG: hypothetical protein K0Q79_3713 [Flavipsychrobacter sp.]|jgi:hypothetical protein|nr:hypothetical protein [Flavipsychrobacter sp.]
MLNLTAKTAKKTQRNAKAPSIETQIFDVEPVLQKRERVWLHWYVPGMTGEQHQPQFPDAPESLAAHKAKEETSGGTEKL